MNETVHLLQQLVALLNQHYRLNLEPEEGQRCAFVDEEGTHFQLEQSTKDAITLTADIGKISASEGDRLLDLLLFNADEVVEGRCIALSQDHSTLLLLATLNADTIENTGPDTWLTPFIIRARALVHTLKVGGRLSEAKLSAFGQQVKPNLALMNWG